MKSISTAINTTHCYRTFGLNLASSFPIPTLAPVAHQSPAPPDVTIRLGPVPTELDNAQITTNHYQVNPDTWLLNAETAAGARFLVKAGREIIVEQTDPNLANIFQLFVLGFCMGATLQQRGTLSLHGNTLARDHHSIMVAGVSGAGKSTLTLALLQQGYRLVADDLSPITLTPQNQPAVQPGYPRLKLWAETCQKFGIDSQKLTRIRPEIDKFSYPVTQQFCTELLPLKTIYLLLPEARDTVVIEPLTGIKKLQELQSHFYGARLPFTLAQKIWPNLLTQITTLAQQIRVCLVRRPIEGFQIDALTQQISQDSAPKTGN